MDAKAISIATIAALSLVAGCGRDGAPWQVGGDHVGDKARPMAVSTTTVTAAEVGRPIGATDEVRYTYGLPKPLSPARVLATARGDVANFDKRLDRLDQLAASAPVADRDRIVGELREMRGQRDALVQDIDALQNAPLAEWTGRRAQLDSDWDALLTRADAVADRITPAP